MATEVLSGPLGELRAASTADGGTALTTAAAFVQIPDGAQQLFLIPRNFATAVVAKIAKNPYLVVLKTPDNFATVTDYSAAAQDASTSTVVTLSSLDTAANLDYLYVGAHLPFRGVNAVVVAANGNASVLTVKYRKSDGTWADASATDGTASGGATMAVSGNVTWTVPTDWALADLVSINSPAPAAAVPFRSLPLYWTRWEVSAALDSSTTLSSLLAMSRSTAYSEWPAGTVVEDQIVKGPGGVGCIEALVNAGTGNLIVNVAVARPGGGFV